MKAVLMSAMLLATSAAQAQALVWADCKSENGTGLAFKDNGTIWAIGGEDGKTIDCKITAPSVLECEWGFEPRRIEFAPGPSILLDGSTLELIPEDSACGEDGMVERMAAE